MKEFLVLYKGDNVAVIVKADRLKIDNGSAVALLLITPDNGDKPSIVAAINTDAVKSITQLPVNATDLSVLMQPPEAK